MQEGDIVRAVVTGVHPYGIDIEAEGRTGFIQPIEVSWACRLPDEVARAGDSLDVYVYAVTPMRFFASIKRAHPDLDPWRDPTRFRVGSRHQATVELVNDWACFVELEPGAEGIIRLDKFPRAYRQGETFRVEVVYVDAATHKIELMPIA